MAIVDGHNDVPECRRLRRAGPGNHFASYGVEVVKPATIQAPSGIRHALVDETLQFCAAFQRWVDLSSDGGLPYARLRLLESLRCTGSETMHAAGERLGMSARNMTNLVDALQREGLVLRRSHPRDRRAVLIDLTDRGRHAAAGYYELRAGAIGSIFDALDSSAEGSLLGILATLRQALRDRGVRA